MSTESAHCTGLTSVQVEPHAPPPATRKSRESAFAPAPTVLVTSVAGSALVVVSTLVTLSTSGVETLSEATSEQFSAVLGLLTVRNLIYLLAFCWGAVGIALVARRLRAVGDRARMLAIGALVLSALSVVAGVAQTVLPLTAAGFPQATFGDTVAYGNWFTASLVTVWCAVAAAGLASLAVRKAGTRRGLMLVLGLVCLAYLIVDITLRGGVPPFAVAFVWLALGVGLRASRVPA